MPFASNTLYSDVHFRRCFNGSTLLHTACYYGLDDVVTDLLALGVEPDIRDYKQATPLHRASDTSCIKV